MGRVCMRCLVIYQPGCRKDGLGEQFTWEKQCPQVGNYCGKWTNPWTEPIFEMIFLD